MNDNQGDGIDGEKLKEEDICIKSSKKEFDSIGEIILSICKYYACGLHQISKAVSFLENDCKLVKNPFEEDGVVRIKNCIDFGFELQTRVDKAGSANTGQDSTFQIAASWQANKNFLFKEKWVPFLLLEIVGLPPQVLGLGFVLRIVSLGVFLREPMKILMRKGSCLLFAFSTSKC
ncbi:hypothetical protein MKW98_005300 [Papaver atlanticum]|uniref:Uncharacterized protein n=1 Tax=Papaver atlanticum TaxID=357466 RepID=A0AAD4RWE8_9MAGN|nr:hypothetical protein MKW98_005300 [Papaver atlanticum]